MLSHLTFRRRFCVSHACPLVENGQEVDIIPDVYDIVVEEELSRADFTIVREPLQRSVFTFAIARRNGNIPRLGSYKDGEEVCETGV